MVSLRTQDWVIKIDYANGTGDGHVVWTLGQGGNFTIIAPPGPIPVVLPPARRDAISTTRRYWSSMTGTPATLTDPNADSRGQELDPQRAER